MKKLLSLLVVGALTVSLCACGGSADASKAPAAEGESVAGIHKAPACCKYNIAAFSGRYRRQRGCTCRRWRTGACSRGRYAGHC